MAVLGASNYTYAEATWTQGLADWIGSHIRAFEFFGGVPEIVVPDNLKSGVTKACRYEPDLNLTYEEMAQHYGVAVVPARPRKPRDKAKVEAGVLLVERWILAALRKRTFFSLGRAERGHRRAARRAQRAAVPQARRLAAQPVRDARPAGAAAAAGGALLSTASGRRPASTSTTTSNSTTTATACPTR